MPPKKKLAWTEMWTNYANFDGIKKWLYDWLKIISNGFEKKATVIILTTSNKIDCAALTKPKGATLFIFNLLL